MRPGLWSWLAIGVVFALVGTIVLIKVASSGPSVATQTSLSPAPPAVFAEVTHVPMRVFNHVGVNSAIVPVVAPIVLGRPDPAAKPFVLFVCTEYSPFCAAERWPLIVALSRFGRFGSLYDVESTAIDYAPSTPSFSFYATSYRSDVLGFHPYEVLSDVVGLHGGGYERLMKLRPNAKDLFARYDPSGVYPLVDVDNEVLVLQTNLSPETFAQTTRDQVAAALSDASDPITQAIVASANYLSAAICHADGQRPGKVCESPGVLAADAALRLGR